MSKSMDKCSKCGSDICDVIIKFKINSGREGQALKIKDMFISHCVNILQAIEAEGENTFCELPIFKCSECDHILKL